MGGWNDDRSVLLDCSDSCLSRSVHVRAHRYNSSPRRLCSRALHGVRKQPDDEVVVLSQVLAHAVNNGYQGYHDLEVRSVNGHKVKNLRHMKELVEGVAEEMISDGDDVARPWIEIMLEGSRLVVIERSVAMEATQEILENFRVSNMCSADLIDK